MNHDDEQLSFAHLMSELNEAMDAKNKNKTHVKHALIQGEYTINTQQIAHKWLNHSFQQVQEVCLGD